MVITRKKSDYIIFEIDNDPHKISEVTKQITKFAHRCNQEIDYFVISEMIANAIEHGNKFDENKKVTINVYVDDELYRVIISDQGEGFDWAGYLDAELDLEGHSDRGRGIIMSRMMCDSLFYNDKGNQVTIVNLVKQGVFET